MKTLLGITLWLRRMFPVMVLFSAGCAKSSSGGGGSSNAPLVKATISGTSVSRQKTNGNARFYVDLNAASTSDVSVGYATQDGTAKGGTDFIATSGTLTIPAGQQEGYIDVTIIGDSLRQSQQAFAVALSNPVKCTLGTATATATIANDGTYLPVDDAGYSTPASYPGYTLAWSDEFNDSTLNLNNWTYETGGSGWGNNELEYYTNRSQNLFLSSGKLIIEARQESYGGNNYTSARINTQGKQSFQYGRIDIRAKLPVTKGMWPALWMLGSNISTVPWPGCGETDIMELVGSAPNQVTGSMHWKNTDGSEGTFNNNYDLTGTDFSKQFHVFSLIWEQDSLQFLVDDNVYVSGGIGKVTSGTYPFNAASFFIFNVAVGGNWPGAPDNTTGFPQRMFVDYVRVFQH